MKVLHLSTTDIEGGAARAAYRLHKGLKSIGLDSQTLVRAKQTIDDNVIADRSVLTRLGPPLSSFQLRSYYQNKKPHFSSQWFFDSLVSKVSKINPSIINLHWICNGFLKIESLSKFKQPMVWTFHDMWALTGGCHYDENCKRYTASCGQCPQLNSSKDADLSREVWKRKARAWSNLNLTIVAPSKWMGECAAASSLFNQTRIEVIPYGLNITIYKPHDRNFLRDLLNLPKDKKLILFGSMSTADHRKGFHLLKQALEKLGQTDLSKKADLVIVGADSASDAEALGFKTHCLGRFGDDLSLALVYAAADVFVAPSLQDNLPNTVLEASACGTPSVAFKIGGMPDMIEHEQNGYLAHPFDIEDLAKGITWILEDDDRHHRLCSYARQKTEQEFNLLLQAERYKSLYEEISLQSYKGQHPNNL